MTRNHALVVAGLGVIGRGILDHFDDRTDWTLSAISRRAPDFETRASFHSVDLSDAKATRSGLAGLGT